MKSVCHGLFTDCFSLFLCVEGKSSTKYDAIAGTTALRVDLHEKCQLSLSLVCFFVAHSNVQTHNWYLYEPNNFTGNFPYFSSLHGKEAKRVLVSVNTSIK